MSQDEYAKALEPFVAGAKPDDRGEVEMYCPLHNDSRRSAAINFAKGAWFCHAGCGGGSIRRLVDSVDLWVPAEGRVKQARPSAGGSAPEGPATVTKADVKRWHRRLVNTDAHEYLYELRGIDLATAKRARIGWDGSRFKIPVFSPDRELWNVRTYDPDPGDRRKIWSVRGMGRARLYPVGPLLRSSVGNEVLFCEGEWDTLLALQTGVLAVTRTDGAGKPWRSEWNEYLADRKVYLCSDRDEAGVKNDEIIGRALDGIAAEVWQCELPFRIRPKHGKDVTDYVLDADEPFKALPALMKLAKKRGEVE